MDIRRIGGTKEIKMKTKTEEQPKLPKRKWNLPTSLIKQFEKSREKMASKKKNVPTVEEGKVREKLKWEKLGFWQKRKLKRKPETSFLIRMFFSNGTSKEFVISTTKETFDYLGRTYYLRYEDAYFNLTQNLYELNYFDDYPVPLDREVVKIGDEKFWTVTSENLKDIIKMEYVKALASSQELNKFLRMNATLSVLIVFMNMVVIYFVWNASKILAFLAGK